MLQRQDNPYAVRAGADAQRGTRGTPSSQAQVFVDEQQYITEEEWPKKDSETHHSCEKCKRWRHGAERECEPKDLVASDVLSLFHRFLQPRNAAVANLERFSMSLLWC